MKDVTYEELEQMYHEAEKERIELDEACEQKQEQIDSLKEDRDRLEVRVEELETDLRAIKPQTVCGELKEDVLRRLRHLSLDELQNIELIYAPKEIGFEDYLD